MKIIAHRCGAGLAPENSLLGIEKSIEAGADYVECDVWLTKDNKLVLCHDDTLLRISGNPTKVRDMKLKDLNMIATHQGQPIATLKEALESAGRTPLIIEGKGQDWAEPLVKLLSSHKGPEPKVISYNERELVAFSELMPHIEVYANEDDKPIEAIHMAIKFRLTGISFASTLYAPWVYWLARRAGLQLIASPMNTPWVVRFFHAFYPKVMITTDYPDRFRNRKRN